MKEIKIEQAPVFTSPNPMTFICSKKADGKTNMATLAFWTYASTNPGKVVFSLNKGAYTLELLAKNKEVVIAVPGVSLAGALIACGTSSGRDTAVSYTHLPLSRLSLFLSEKTSSRRTLRSRVPPS